MAKQLAVITGAILTCPNRPIPLGFISTNDSAGYILQGKSIGSINDNKPETNIVTSECTICANGNIPCVPKFPKPWMEGVPTVRDASVILLTKNSKIFCSTGNAIIEVEEAGQNFHFLGKEESENEEKSEEENESSAECEAKGTATTVIIADNGLEQCGKLKKKGKKTWISRACTVIVGTGSVLIGEEVNDACQNRDSQGIPDIDTMPQP